MNPTTTISRKRIALLILGVSLAAGFLLWRISRSTNWQAFGTIVARVNTDQKVVALTFDDGPVPGRTEEVLATLGAAGVKGTFFFTGGELEQNPHLGRLVASAGHEIGNHSYSHQRMVFLLPETVAMEIERTDDLIRQLGQTRTTCFRPPYGKKLFLLPWYLAKAGKTSVTWDVAPDGDPTTSAASLTATVLREVRPGSIVLLHVLYESRKTSREALPQIIAGLRDAGYRFATVSELLALGAGKS